MEQSDIYWKQEITHQCSLFTSQIEWVGDLVYLHCTVHRNTPNAIREVKKELHHLLNRFYKEGKEEVYAYLIKGRFAAMLGGEYLTSFVSEGIQYEVYRYATSSSVSGCSDCSRSKYIQRCAAEPSPKEGCWGTERCSRYIGSSAEESGDAGSEGADSKAANNSGTDSARSKQSRSLDEFW